MKLKGLLVAITLLTIAIVAVVRLQSPALSKLRSSKEIRELIRSRNLEGISRQLDGKGKGKKPPTKKPTKQPTNQPTKQPTTNQPTKQPTKQPTQCRKEFQQCGGKNYNGATCCQAGLKCRQDNGFYSQCVEKAPSGNCKRQYQECGGLGYNGVTCCQEGLICKKDTSHWHACKRAGAKNPTKNPTQFPSNNPTKMPSVLTHEPTTNAAAIETDPPVRKGSQPTPFPTFKPNKVVCAGSRQVYEFAGLVSECSLDKCGGEKCEYRKTHKGMHITSCGFPPGNRPKSATSVEEAKTRPSSSETCTVNVLSEPRARRRRISSTQRSAVLLASKMKCASGVTFISTFSKLSLETCTERCRSLVRCSAFIYTSIRSCKLLETAVSCKIIQGYKQSLYKLAEPSSDSWTSMLSIQNSDDLKQYAGGKEHNVRSIIEGLMPVEEAGDFVVGLSTSGTATLFLEGNLVAFADKSSAGCGDSGMTLGAYTVSESGVKELVVEYINEEEDARLDVVIYSAKANVEDLIASCAAPAEEAVLPVALSTLFTFDPEECEEGYSGEFCTSAVCSTACANGGSCLYPHQCFCKKGFSGYSCEECAAGFSPLAGTCVQMTLIVSFAGVATLLVVAAILTPRVKHNIELARLTVFLEDEIIGGFDESRNEKGKTWTAAKLLKSKTGLASSKYKSSPMWSLLSKQKAVDLRLMKSHFIPKSSLALGEKFAFGASGQVCRAKYDGNPVCVKQLFSALIDPSDMNEFIHEASVLAELVHPQIVRFYGVAVDGERMYIVTELCSGSLESFISDQASKGGLSARAKMNILLQISRGMEYVHHLGLVHRDLKLGNVLVESFEDDICKIKICDFGVATVAGQTQYKDLVGTPGHIAPEVIIGDVKPHLVKKMDVFSFGMIMWYVFADEADAEKSMESFQSSDELNAAIAKRFRPDIPCAWPAEIKALISECWQKNPQKRPSFADVSPRISKALSTFHDLETFPSSNADSGGPILHKSWVGRIASGFSNLFVKAPLTAPPRLAASKNNNITQNNGHLSVDLSNPACVEYHQNPLAKHGV